MAATALKRVPNTGAIREPSTRTLLEWTPAQLRSAEVLADGGNLQLAADLCEFLLADDRIQGVLTARTRGLLGLQVEFEKSGDGRRSGRAVKALEAGEDWWLAFPEHEIGALLDWGILLGVGLAQVDWRDTEDGTRVVPRLQRWHARWLRYDWTARGWRLCVDGGKEIEIAGGDGSWVLHTPSGDNRPWADGAWRSLSRWALLKAYARQDFARHSEVHGTPIRAGIAPETSARTDREQLAADLAELGRDTGMCLPPGYDLKLVEATAKTWEMFRAQVEMADLAIAIRLAGQNLTTDVSGGSLAAAKVHAVIRSDIIRCDAESAATTLHDQALTHWARLNFGDAKLAPWPSWPTDPPEDQLVVAQTREAQGKAITALRAAGVDVKPVLEQFGLEESPEAMAALKAQQDAALEAAKNPEPPPGKNDGQSPAAKEPA